MFLETSQKHTRLYVQTTLPGMKMTLFLKPLLLPRQRFRVQFLYQLITTSQSQKKMTVPWDQVPAILWTFPPTTLKRRSLFPLRVLTNRGVQCASVGAPPVTMIMLQTFVCNWS